MDTILCFLALRRYKTEGFFNFYLTLLNFVSKFWPNLIHKINSSLALTHERVPLIAPLPDLILDNIQYQPWGLDASEILIMISIWTAFMIALFHKHRFYIISNQVFRLYIGSMFTLFTCFLMVYKFSLTG
jgi:hypothetical protein